ncbi:HNH/ENDO VII family nuclease [Avibacterium sp. 20-15]|uniref:HNH/ENDO VII family nuclease n=1 Tax=unclassified Avibacterium TaxID=2685287 RepID=UPI002025DD93|nr:MULTISPECIES: HNH/ENDO VII family nuclease [unclassified Avibacterium]MCW9733540.1 HNH/ENDO VII family nuclease [Avibacterium sp. 20-15]URL03398.1 HNH/ENDO VII family nuclease [Avibacterium sp. 20-132]
MFNKLETQETPSIDKKEVNSKELPVWADDKITIEDIFDEANITDKVATDTKDPSNSENVMDCLAKEHFTPVKEETIEKLTLIWPSEIVDMIKSEEEADIYQGASLMPKEINGKFVLCKEDIDLNQKDELGRTNLGRMQQGLAPLDKGGKPIELHHIGQNQNSPLAELTSREHRGPGNHTILHDVKKESEIDRESFKKEKEEHWKERAAEIIEKQGV